MKIFEAEFELVAVALFVIFGGALVATGIYLSAQEEQEWRAFKETHHCKVVGRSKGDLVTTVAPVIGGNEGVMVGISAMPDKTGWLCDDGVTYWR